MLYTFVKGCLDNADTRELSTVTYPVALDLEIDVKERREG